MTAAEAPEEAPWGLAGPRLLQLGWRSAPAWSLPPTHRSFRADRWASECRLVPSSPSPAADRREWGRMEWPVRKPAAHSSLLIAGPPPPSSPPLPAAVAPRGA